MGEPGSHGQPAELSHVALRVAHAGLFLGDRVQFGEQGEFEDSVWWGWPPEGLAH